MKTRTRILILTAIGSVLGLAALVSFCIVMQVDAWSKINYRQRSPAAELPIEVVGRQFEWRVRYPSSSRMQNDPQLVEHFALEAETRQSHADDVHLVNELHVWKGGKVKIHLTTGDVLHSFFLPHLRVKQDAFPGKTIPAWFDADTANTVYKVYDPDLKRWVPGGDPTSEAEQKRGPAQRRWTDGYRYDKDRKQWVEDKKHIWDLTCAEPCGSGHYKMQGRLYVHETRADFLRWLEQAGMRPGEVPGGK